MNRLVQASRQGTATADPGKASRTSIAGLRNSSGVAAGADETAEAGRYTAHITIDCDDC
jgi:hypothetical protein